MRFKNDIITPYGANKKIAQELNCSVVTVRSALLGVTHTPKAKKIRELAISKYNGIEREYNNGMVRE